MRKWSKVLLLAAGSLGLLWVVLNPRRDSSPALVPSESVPTAPGDSRAARGPARIHFEELFAARFAREGIRFHQLTDTNVTAAPRIPSRFRSESDGPWDKVFAKLNDQFGYVVLWPEMQSDAAASRQPATVAQIGKYLYVGDDPADLAALQSFATGNAEQRFDAINHFADDALFAEPLFTDAVQRDGAPEVKIEAARKLQGFKSARSVNTLIAALGDPDDAVQAAARASLVWQGGGAVGEALRVAARSPDERLALAARSLLEERHAP